MRLVLRGNTIAAPGVECVVQGQGGVEHRVVVLRVQAGQAQRERQQPGGLRGEVKAVGIGTTHNGGQQVQCRISQIKAQQQGVKAAQLPHMGHRCAWDVIGHRIQRLRLCQHFAGRHIEELGAGIDKTTDQPGAGDAVDLGSLAGDPARRLFARHTPVSALGKGKWRRRTPLGHDRCVIHAVLTPFNAAVESLRKPPGSRQGGHSVCAHVVSVNAVSKHLLRRSGGRQRGDILRCATLGTSQQAQALVKARLTAHIEHQR